LGAGFTSVFTALHYRVVAMSCSPLFKIIYNFMYFLKSALYPRMFCSGRTINKPTIKLKVYFSSFVVDMLKEK